MRACTGCPTFFTRISSSKATCKGAPFATVRATVCGSAGLLAPGGRFRAGPHRNWGKRTSLGARVHARGQGQMKGGGNPKNGRPPAQGNFPGGGKEVTTNL